MQMNKNARVDIRQEFINEQTRHDTDVQEVKLTKRLISWLFRHYYTDSLSFDYYDIDSSWSEFAPVTWDRRISTCVWQDYYDDGCWCDSQREVDKLTRSNLNAFRKGGHLKHRCWLGAYTFSDVSRGIHVYLYGRDIHEYDVHCIMKKRK